MRGGLLIDALLLAVPAEAAKQAAVPNRFGAIAYHRASQSWGVGHNYARARDANVEALKQCGHGKCEVVHKFKNGCAALADGPKIQAAASGATRDEAETKTLRRCAEANRPASCNLIAWACTR
jgi:alpha-ketoglutarate-dependent taurine dioxygenase